MEPDPDTDLPFAQTTVMLNAARVCLQAIITLDLNAGDRAARGLRAYREHLAGREGDLSAVVHRQAMEGIDRFGDDIFGTDRWRQPRPSGLPTAA